MQHDRILESPTSQLYERHDELIRPVFDETDDTQEILKQRELAVAYLGKVSAALCIASSESIHTINTIIGLNMKLHERGVHQLPQTGLEAAL